MAKAEQEMDFSGLSDKVDLSPEGMLKHNLGVLQAVASIAATVGHHYKVELRGHMGLHGPAFAVHGDIKFVIRGDDGIWVAFTYEEALAFLVEVASGACREVHDGT
jgi:hypothetical protein